MNKVEMGTFFKLFTQNGYVLNFSTSDFNAFTLDSVGVALCQHYGLSKAKSLMKFCEEHFGYESDKLLFDLLEYYDLYISHLPYAEKDKAVFEKCMKIYEREKNSIELKLPEVKVVDHQYIKDLAARASKDIDNNEFDSCLTKSRTMLEETFIFLLEKHDIKNTNKGDINKLYREVKELFQMHQRKDADKRINNLLSGFEKIITSISDMRNISSDSHGQGSNRITIEEHHARLFLNSAVVMCEFYLSVDKKFCAK